MKKGGYIENSRSAADGRNTMAGKWGELENEKMTNDKSPRTPEGGQALKKDNTYQFDNKGLFEAKGMRVARAGEMGELENERM
ncbi:MAG: hypothetical protein ACFNO5_03955 [Porphyromonas pasteri]